MLLAIERDTENWCESRNALLQFTNETMDLVLEKVHHCWEGTGNIVGLKSDQYVMAWILDPDTSPSIVDLPVNWLQSCCNVLKRFYVDQCL